MFQLKFHDYRVVQSTNRRGGIWLFWKNTVDLTLFSEETNLFHVLFHFRNIKPEVLITGIHAPSAASPRHQLWRDLHQELPPEDTPWLVI